MYQKRVFDILNQITAPRRTLWVGNAWSKMHLVSENPPLTRQGRCSHLHFQQITRDSNFNVNFVRIDRLVLVTFTVLTNFTRVALLKRQTSRHILFDFVFLFLSKIVWIRKKEFRVLTNINGNVCMMMDNVPKFRTQKSIYKCVF